MDLVLRLELTEEGADVERLDELTGFLRHELLQLEVEDVLKPSASEPPPGARGLNATAVGGLLVSLSSAAEGLAAVISAVKAWLTRGVAPHRNVRLEIDGDVLELSDATALDQDRLIGLFIGRHATDGREQ
jgi:hypothetical protein